MNDDQKAIQLQQLANIVIDAYLDRDKQFTPDFEGSNAIMYMSRPVGDKNHPNLKTDIWYERADYESTVTPREKKAKRSPQK